MKKVELEVYIKDVAEIAYKRGYQKGYRAGRNYIGYGLTYKKLIENFNKLQGESTITK